MISVANRKVLVLNKGWNPIAVVSLQRAMGLICGIIKGTDEPKARIIDVNQSVRDFTWKDWSKLKAAEGEEVLRSAKDKFRIPEIIVLSRYNKLPQQRVHFSRRTIYRRDGNKCQYCGCRPGVSELTADHIIPRSKGGLTDWTNVILACTECNRDKADIMPKKISIVEKGQEVTAYIVYFNSNRFPGKKKIIKQPVKPKFTFFKSDYRCKSWEEFLGIAYWEVELKSDM